MLSGRREPLFNRLPPVVVALTAVIVLASSIQLISQWGFVLEPWVANWMFDAGAIAGGAL